MRETSECRPASSGQSVAVVIVNDAPSNTVVTLSYFFSLSYFPFLPVSVPYLFLSLSSPRAFLFYLNRTAIRPLNHRTTQLSNHPCFPPTQPPTYPATTHPSYRANQPSDRINRSSEIYTRCASIFSLRQIIRYFILSLFLPTYCSFLIKNIYIRSFHILLRFQYVLTSTIEYSRFFEFPWIFTFLDFQLYVKTYLITYMIDFLLQMYIFKSHPQYWKNSLAFSEAGDIISKQYIVNFFKCFQSLFVFC